LGQTGAGGKWYGPGCSSRGRALVGGLGAPSLRSTWANCSSKSSGSAGGPGLECWCQTGAGSKWYGPGCSSRGKWFAGESEAASLGQTGAGADSYGPDCSSRGIGLSGLRENTSAVLLNPSVPLGWICSPRPCPRWIGFPLVTQAKNKGNKMVS